MALSASEQPHNFYPRPPRGGRPPRQTLWGSLLYFYPRPPRGGRQKIAPVIRPVLSFLSTPSARRATTEGWMRPVRWQISIHALREEGDRAPVEYGCALGDFYPRPPRGGRRMKRNNCEKPLRFLSTPSARRATPAQQGRQHVKLDFYPRPPRGGRRNVCCRQLWSRLISIHALREEGD